MEKLWLIEEDQIKENPAKNEKVEDMFYIKLYHY